VFIGKQAVKVKSRVEKDGAVEMLTAEVDVMDLELALVVSVTLVRMIVRKIKMPPQTRDRGGEGSRKSTFRRN
jgi:hypothetical protein